MPITLLRKLPLLIGSLLPTTFLLLASTAHSGPVGFDVDGNGFALAAGTKVTNQYSAIGITVSATGGSGDAMIFDSANPTGGDSDLGTPNSNFGGPGIGTGGNPSNDTALGNILIISEDGDSNDPDDAAGGGTIRFDFASEVIMNSIGILDIDRTEGQLVELFGLGGSLGSFGFQDLGNNSYQRIDFNTLSGVTRMDVVFSSSGAITDFDFTNVPEPAAVSLLGIGLLGLGLARRRRG